MWHWPLAVFTAADNPEEAEAIPAEAEVILAAVAVIPAASTGAEASMTAGAMMVIMTVIMTEGTMAVRASAYGLGHIGVGTRGIILIIIRITIRTITLITIHIINILRPVSLRSISKGKGHVVSPRPGLLMFGTIVRNPMPITLM